MPERPCTVKMVCVRTTVYMAKNAQQTHSKRTANAQQTHNKRTANKRLPKRPTNAYYLPRSGLSMVERCFNADGPGRKKILHPSSFILHPSSLILCQLVPTLLAKSQFASGRLEVCHDQGGDNSW
jgi:hypothetical protein